jgi:anti-sigma B factor antagonist
MELSFHTRNVGDVTVVTCTGQLVAGPETAAFEAHLDELIAVHPRILLHLGDVTFVDSSGLGLLVRYLTRAQNASGALRVCAVSPIVDRVLTVTRLKTVLQPFDTEAQAFLDVHRSGREASASPQILCIDSSEDVLAYLRELLRSDGYRPTTVSNIPDAMILLSALRPRVVVLGEAFRAVVAARQDFARLTASCVLVNLPAGFARQEARIAAVDVLATIREAIDS